MSYTRSFRILLYRSFPIYVRMITFQQYDIHFLYVSELFTGTIQFLYIIFRAQYMISLFCFTISIIRFLFYFTVVFVRFSVVFSLFYLVSCIVIFCLSSYYLNLHLYSFYQKMLLPTLQELLFRLYYRCRSIFLLISYSFPEIPGPLQSNNWNHHSHTYN